ncbi:class I SAM-dependent methyltransferase [Propionicicella superfundia]|uniref:class I SAM-dependent methyltransferase n=1 Tax=Propionicicella superfundia TaxID=348582 RepID=UPI0004039D81|nr:methyltransferase [Propionicicella superfundia]
MSHYFETPSGADVRREITVTLFDTPFTVETSGGVFSGDRLDLGTAVLLRSVFPRSGSRRLLDLGCGYGPIALALAAACPAATVDAVDVNDRALELTRDNAARHGFGDRIRALRPDEASRSDRYDEIWSNPPIRIGKTALHDLLVTWLGRLADDGVAQLVVGRNLGADSLQSWLQGQGWDASRTASAKGFRVLTVTRPR